MLCAFVSGVKQRPPRSSRCTPASRQSDLSDAIRRLQAYQDAGADVLLATDLPTVEAVRSGSPRSE
jgi:hypothetical protein